MVCAGLKGPGGCWVWALWWTPGASSGRLQSQFGRSRVDPPVGSVGALTVDAGSQCLELLFGLCRIDPTWPVARQRAGWAGQFRPGRPAQAPREAAPGPVLGPCDEPGPQRIPFHVAHHREQVFVLFDRKRLEAPLPHAPTRAVGPMESERVSRQQPLHPSADVAGAVLCCHDMEVVRHDADGEQLEFRAKLRIPNESKEPGIVARCVEDDGAVVATVHQVIVTARDE